MNTATTSGGSATYNLSVSDPRPAINRFLNVGYPDGGNAEIQVFASNLLAKPGGSTPFTKVLVQGKLIPAANVQMDPSVPPAWIKFYVPGAQMIPGYAAITLQNGNVDSLPTPAPIVHPLPILSSVRITSYTTGANGKVTVALTGSKFYPDSFVTLNGLRYPLPTTFGSATSLTASFPYSVGLKGLAAALAVTNPYGGNSGLQTVVWP